MGRFSWLGMCRRRLQSSMVVTSPINQNLWLDKASTLHQSLFQGRGKFFFHLFIQL
ncbi:hypothetical protein Pint_08413 [Pistacia integerrima]|uniref:Uncharacterized protein n=1 Tax=Pistacia integerrima TaxID=434235 RepID=A0ACC0XST0_9ROSI|nr:hypothetical protein Pint_08413 [Pistacia integerrima]